MQVKKSKILAWAIDDIKVVVLKQNEILCYDFAEKEFICRFENKEHFNTLEIVCGQIYATKEHSPVLYRMDLVDEEHCEVEHFEADEITIISTTGEYGEVAIQLKSGVRTYKTVLYNVFVHVSKELQGLKEADQICFLGEESGFHRYYCRGDWFRFWGFGARSTDVWLKEIGDDGTIKDQLGERTIFDLHEFFEFRKEKIGDMKFPMRDFFWLNPELKYVSKCGKYFTYIISRNPE